MGLCQQPRAMPEGLDRLPEVRTITPAPQVGEQGGVGWPTEAGLEASLSAPHFFAAPATSAETHRLETDEPAGEVAGSVPAAGATTLQRVICRVHPWQGSTGYRYVPRRQLHLSVTARTPPCASVRPGSRILAVVAPSSTELRLDRGRRRPLPRDEHAPRALR